MHGEPIRFRHIFQEFKVTDDEIRLGDDAQFEAAMARKLFQNSARDFVAAFGRLVGIGGGAERDCFVRLHAMQFVAEQSGGVLLHVDLLLELHAVAHFHEFVGVAGIAVTASELAAAVGIDRPGKRHLPVADAAVEQRLGRKSEVFDIVPFAQRFACRGEARDANQAGLIEQREQGQGSHKDSPFVRLR